VIPDIIHKSRSGLQIAPNMSDYERAHAGFSGQARDASGSAGAVSTSRTRRSIAAQGDRCGSLALRWLGKGGAQRISTYAELRDLTNRFANVLQGLGLAPGARVFVLAGRIPELYVAMLGR
jgi:acetyl-CoA synthetase